MDPFKIEGEKMIVDCYAVELYLPAEYADSAYRGTPYYALLGTKVKYIGIGNFRFFKSEAEMKDPDKIPCYPYVVPMFITCNPSDIDTRDVRFIPHGRVRKSLVLTFIKGDEFMCSTEVIKSSDALMVYLARLESGKMDHIPPEVVVMGLRDCEQMNGVSLRVPMESEELFVSRMYQDPNHPERQYRYHTGGMELDKIRSQNARTTMQTESSFGAFFFEDVNNSLIMAVNRKNRGDVDEPNAFERVVRGLPMEDLKESDKEQFDLTAHSAPPSVEDEEESNTTINDEE